MKKLLLLFLLSITFSLGFAQSAELKAALAQVNQTLKDYTLGTEDYSTFSMISGSEYYKYTASKFSFIYPNLIFDYTIKGNGLMWTDAIKEGVYSVIIPLNSTIEYPGTNNIYDWGRKEKSDYCVSFRNESGLTKKTNGKASIINCFSIEGEKLTVEKFAKELQNLQRLLISENYKGSMGVNAKSKGASSKEASTTKKVGKYVQ